MALEIIKKKDEELVEYLIRLYENKQAYGLNNQDIADLLNKEDEDDVDYDESRWRKLYQAWKNYFEAYTNRQAAKNGGELNQYIIDGYEKARIELEKEKVRFRDQKREYNKMIRNAGRWEHVVDTLIENVQALDPKDIPVMEAVSSNEKELLVLLNDIHLGMVVDNRFNKYNSTIAQERLNKVKQRVYNTVVKEDIDTLHIANLGDAIHGTVHASVKLQSEEDAIQQIIKVSEMLIEFIKTFLDMGIHIKYFNVVGNHGRLSKKGEEVSPEENFEKLILTIIDATLANYKNYDSQGCQDGFVEAEIAGRDVILTHGHLDQNSNSAYKLPQLLQRVPDLICSGHVHHMLQKDFGTTLIEVSPSLSGLDLYASSGRYSGRAGQKMILFEDGDIASTSTIYVQ